MGECVITRDDFVIADENGVLFVAQKALREVVAAAASYRDTEARQLSALREGRSYRAQTRFTDYAARRARQPDYGFRQHLKDIEAAGEV